MISAGQIAESMKIEAAGSETLTCERVVDNGVPLKVRYVPNGDRCVWYANGKRCSEKTAIRAILGWSF